MDQESLQRCGQWHMARPMTGRAPHASFVVKEVYLLRFSSFSFCQPFPVVLNPSFPLESHPGSHPAHFSCSSCCNAEVYGQFALRVWAERCPAVPLPTALWVHQPLVKYQILPYLKIDNNNRFMLDPYLDTFHIKGKVHPDMKIIS